VIALNRGLLGIDVVGEFMKPAFYIRSDLTKSAVLGHAEQFANNINKRIIPGP
jgi:hypothetical protein